MTHYNPDWLDDDTLVAGFIARKAEFVFLRGELARVPLQGSAQHHILVGPRGAGKTTLLKRLAVAIRRDDDLRDHLIALSFPEELYHVKDLAGFWWAACEALADELDHLGRDKATAERLYDAVDGVRSPGAAGAASSNAGLACLLGVCAELQRRPVLLVDNFDMVLDRIDTDGRKLKNPLSPVYWALREELSKDVSPVVIGGSVRLSEPFKHYDKAFYDFFLPRRLGMLPLEEVREVIRHLAEVNRTPEVVERLEMRPARIGTLHQLTGGNPRAVGLIFELLRQGPGRRAIEDFERLMDLTTPYYKDRIEELSEQAQVVMRALAVRMPGKDGDILRFGHTAAEIAAHAGLETKTVSAQLNILENDGLVEKLSGQGRTQYRIVEQLFRLWLQMRTSRRIRQNVVGLSQFLEAMFDQEELAAQLPGARGLLGAKYAQAVAFASRDESLRSGLEAYGAGLAYEHAALNGDDVRELLGEGDVPPEVERCLELRERLRGSDGHALDKEEQDGLLGSLELRPERKERLVEALCGGGDAAAGEVMKVREMLKRERGMLLRYGLKDEDLPLLFDLRAAGRIPLPGLAPPHADAVCQTCRDPKVKAMLWRLAGALDYVKFTAESAQAWLDWGLEQARAATSEEWANVAGSMRRSKQFEIAEETLQEAFKRGVSARALYEKGTLLDEKDADYAEAEAAYRKAIELDPSDAWPWYALGNLLQDHLQRYEEAEQAYRKAIELDPAWSWPWNNLGNLLMVHQQRYEEAEQAYRKAIELDPAWSWPWNNLGNLLMDHLQRYEEAEQAYRRAIELDPAYGKAWGNLGRCLELLGRFNEAREAYEKAAELDTKYSSHWRDRLEQLIDREKIADVNKKIVAWDRDAIIKSLRAVLVIPGQASKTFSRPEFVEDLLGGVLREGKHADPMADVMRELGFEKQARPLLLAFEAAVQNEEASLSNLEPEVRSAAQTMYRRLMNGKKKHLAAKAGEKKKKNKKK